MLFPKETFQTKMEVIYILFYIKYIKDKMPLKIISFLDQNILLMILNIFKQNVEEISY